MQVCFWTANVLITAVWAFHDIWSVHVIPRPKGHDLSWLHTTHHLTIFIEWDWKNLISKPKLDFYDSSSQGCNCCFPDTKRTKSPMYGANLSGKSTATMSIHKKKTLPQSDEIIAIHTKNNNIYIQYMGPERVALSRLKMHCRGKAGHVSSIFHETWVVLGFPGDLGYKLGQDCYYCLQLSVDPSPN